MTERGHGGPAAARALIALGVRYDLVMQAFGGRGKTAENPHDMGSALERAPDSGEPHLVNVLTTLRLPTLARRC